MHHLYWWLWLPKNDRSTKKSLFQALLRDYYVNWMTTMQKLCVRMVWIWASGHSWAILRFSSNFSLNILIGYILIYLSVYDTQAVQIRPVYTKFCIIQLAPTIQISTHRYKCKHPQQKGGILGANWRLNYSLKDVADYLVGGAPVQVLLSKKLKLATV